MKILITVIALCLITTLSFADRVEDLQKENQQLNQEVTKRQNEITQITQMMLENIGRIKELQKIEKDKEKEK